MVLDKKPMGARVRHIAGPETVSRLNSVVDPQANRTVFGRRTGTVTGPTTNVGIEAEPMQKVLAEWNGRVYPARVDADCRETQSFWKR
jgi:hypothetical protein